MVVTHFDSEDAQAQRVQLTCYSGSSMPSLYNVTLQHLPSRGDSISLPFECGRRC